MRIERAGHSPLPSRDTFALWLGVLAGPVLLLAQQTLAYALVPDACTRQSSVFVHLTHLATLLLIGGGFLLCRREWARVGRGEPDERPGPEHRARFMAFGGMVSNVFFALLVLAQWLATALFSPCSV
ncbi:MAG TPA: hypothetical protein VGO40_19480 [Longimicrobium sp.]|jgi:hypothetical protein|nr:hypothetical protein [Longimicrobium sp.]